MAKNDKKLELTWYNKDKSLYFDSDKKKYQWVDRKDPRVSEPRIFLEKAVYGDKNTENILIKGDNLLALKALLPDYEGKVKLIYIDPPFNTGSAFEFYDDGLEHSIWLTMMRDRLELLKKLLKKDGVIFVHIDDHEQARLKILMDEVLGEQNFITTLCVKMSHLSGVKMSHLKKKPPKIKEFILIYGKQKDLVEFEPLYERASWWDVFDRYTQFIIRDLDKPNDFSLWKVKPLKKAAEESGIDTSNDDEFEKFCLRNADKIFRTARNRSEIFQRLPRDNKFRIITTATGLQKLVYNKEEVLFAKEKLTNGFPVSTLGDIWTNIGINNLHNEGGVSFRFGKKPERLLHNIIKIATKEGDLVLDSFAGSGTTGAVAHKMNRKWIMVELGEHAKTHIIPRLKRVISGEDQSGISKEVGWKGGGGFKYFELGDSLFVADDDLRLTVLNPKVYNGALIRAVLKVEGFKLLNPDNALHGISGRTIAHVTEQYLNQDYINAILREVGDAADYLIIYAKTISSKIKLPENVEIRKIPDVLLKKFKV